MENTMFTVIVALQFGVYKAAEAEYLRIQRLRAGFFGGTNGFNDGIDRIKLAGFGTIPSRAKFDAASDWHTECRGIAWSNGYRSVYGESRRGPIEEAKAAHLLGKRVNWPRS